MPNPTCMCVVQRTGELCGNRARYSNFAGDVVCGNHTRSRSKQNQRDLLLTTTIYTTDNNTDNYCCICQVRCDKEYADVMRTRCCGHYFHTYCLDAWIQSKQPSSNTCPLCRDVIPPDIKHGLDIALRSGSHLNNYTKNMMQSLRRNLLFEEFIYV